MRETRNGIALLLLAAVTFASTPAFAGADGRRNTAIGLGAATLYELGKGHDGTALLFGAATAVAWQQYEIQRRREAQQHRAQQAASTGGYSSGGYTNAGYSNSSYSSYPAGTQGYSNTGYSSATAYHPIRAYSSKRVARAAHGRHAVRRPARHVVTAPAVARVRSEASSQEGVAVRETALQRNLTQVAAQVKTVKKQNDQLQSQLAAVQQDNARAQQRVDQYFHWALLATLLALVGISGLTVAYFRHPPHAASGTIIRSS